MKVTLPCAQCGSSFSRNHYPSQPEPKFCSRSCASRHSLLHNHAKLETPAQKARARATLEKARQSPAMRKYLNSERNPFKGAQAETIRKASTEANRRLGFPTLTGGNGELTIPQELLLKLLGSEFTPECSVSLGPRQPGYPTHYKTDLGCRRLKLAVELDGNSHRAKSRQAMDRKKDAKLASLGWTVMRFRNEEVLSDISGILRQIQEIMSQLEF